MADYSWLLQRVNHLLCGVHTVFIHILTVINYTKSTRTKFNSKYLLKTGFLGTDPFRLEFSSSFSPASILSVLLQLIRDSWNMLICSEGGSALKDLKYWGLGVLIPTGSHSPVVKNSPCNSGVMGLIPDEGNKIPHDVGQLSSQTLEPMYHSQKVLAPQQQIPHDTRKISCF